MKSFIYSIYILELFGSFLLLFHIISNIVCSVCDVCQQLLCALLYYVPEHVALVQVYPCCLEPLSSLLAPSTTVEYSQPSTNRGYLS